MAKGPRRDLEKERAWRELISGQSGSGLSVRVWCLQQGVSEASFYAWKRELAQRDQAADEAAPRLVEVIVKEESSRSIPGATSAPLQVHIADVRIEVPAGFDAETLKAAIEALRAVAC